NGTARFSSPLSVDDFVKRSSYICFDKNALESVRNDAEGFALREGLDAHAKSVSVRFS
ncbi:MAG: histidinol dehydrogenase, partial [Oscillospiraceae bacterium]|nr:histidinol dehydrogenase [Oscillospiraceae bacterium]